MEIRATILCENCVFFSSSAIAEHGWSVYLETEQGNFLFDAGGGKAIINNARCFNKDLSKVKGIMLSHNHYDHTGGLLPVLDYTGKVKVYSHPEIFKDSYSIRNGVERFIGIPYRKEALESKGAQFVFNTAFTEIAPGIMLSGEVPRRTSFERGDVDLVLKSEKRYVQDIVLDDQSLIINSKRGLVIVLGCSHSGIVNIINHAIEKTGQSHIHTIFGGTHLGPASAEVRTRSIEALKKFDIERIGTSHCTGLEAAMQVRQEFGARFFFCNVGTVIEV